MFENAANVEVFGVVWLYSASLGKEVYWILIVWAVIVNMLVSNRVRLVSAIIAGLWYYYATPGGELDVSLFTAYAWTVILMGWLSAGAIGNLFGLLLGAIAVNHVKGK
jgi:hypothetical protein